MIRISHLTRDYGSLRAVDDLSFSVAPGEILGLVGANGAGKTTTLHCACGIIPPTNGAIWIGGVAMDRDPVAAKRQLEFIPDTPVAFDQLTVLEHLQFVARVFGVQNWTARADALLEELSLGDKRHQLPAALSRGMRQKLAICQAFLHEPKAILCDEPLSGLDPLGIHSVRQALGRRAREGAALVVSSHQLELVSALSDRILILHEGRCLLLGTLDEIRSRFSTLGERATLEDVFLAALQDGEMAQAPSVAGADSDGNAVDR